MNNIVNQMLSFYSKLGVPQQCMSDPNSILQYLMNSGKLSQEQYNHAVNQARQMQNNPMIKQLFNR